MATGRIRRKARRGIAVAVLGWLCAAVAAVLLAPSASAAPSVTVEIKNFTPPVASVDAGGTVTFVNRIPAQNKGGISIPLVGNVSATVYTDVAVTFFGQKRPLQTGQSTAWTFDAPATNGTIEYTYRIVPQSGLTAAVANQVVNTVAGQLPALPAPIPYVVQTIAPDLPTLPGVNLPDLPEVAVPLPETGVLPTVPGAGPAAPPVEGAPAVPPPNGTTTRPVPQGYNGSPYQYNVDAPQQVVPVDAAAAAAFDPARFFVPGESVGNPDSADSGAGSGGAGGGSGGQPGGYDGATVPVFGQLAGLDDASFDEQAAQDAADSPTAGQTLPAAALVAVVALAAVTAALVRTHQMTRSNSR
jgi:hypothetical protein